jgi:hypothetical protein
MRPAGGDLKHFYANSAFSRDGSCTYPCIIRFDGHKLTQSVPDAILLVEGGTEMPVIRFFEKEEEARNSGLPNVRENPNDKWYPWIADEHTGFCLSASTSYFYDDDRPIYHMLIWDPATKEPRSVGGSWNSKADATPEVRAAHEAWQERKREEERKAREDREARTPRKGKTIRVVRGRKVPIGTVGTCIWYGEGKAFSWHQARYGSPMRVGLKTADGTVFWTAASNVEVVIEEARAA